MSPSDTTPPVSGPGHGTASGHYLHNLMLFGRLLHKIGLDSSPNQMMALIEALAYINPGSRTDFYNASRALLVNRFEDLPLFDAAFELFWRKHWKAPSGKGQLLGNIKPQKHSPLIMPPALEKEQEEGEKKRQGQPPEPPPDDEAPDILEGLMTFSTRAVLRHKDFADLTAEELAEIRHMMAALVWNLGLRRTRRFRRGDGPRFDMRRTIRNSLRTDGEMIDWATRKPAFKPRPLIVIADISGSMERYTRLLLHFLYSLTSGLDQSVECFVFSTNLTRITRQLRRRDIDQALREVGHEVDDWSGGTRTGESLHTFNYEWGRRVLGRGAVVILISDGWDRGDADLLRREMARLQRTTYRLIWLNPLLGSANYEPLTRGMQTCLPYIDDFLPVHNLASLETLAEHLATLDTRPGVRRIYARRHA